MNVSKELSRIAKSILSYDDPEKIANQEAFTADIARKMLPLRKKYGISTIRQNYKGTGSKKATRQLWIRLDNDQGVDVWLEPSFYKIGGVTINRIKGTFYYGDKTSSQIAEEICKEIKEAFGSKVAKVLTAETKEIAIDKNLFQLRLLKGSFLGPNFYARTSDKLEKALAQNKPIKAFMTEAGGPYGSNVVVEIDGVKLPLTKGKIRNRDFDYFFGNQPRY